VPVDSGPMFWEPLSAEFQLAGYSGIRIDVLSKHIALIAFTKCKWLKDLWML